MEQFLNPAEVRALEELKKIDTESIWGIAINNVVKSDEPVLFRRLICELKSQASDCAETMKNILGNAYESVIAL